MTELIKHPMILQNDRVRLVPMESADLKPLAEIAIDPTIWGYGGYFINNESDLEIYIRDAIDMREKNTGYPFTIADIKSGFLAGSSRYCNISPEHKRIEIGYTWLGKKFHGTGLNANMKYLMIEHAFEKLRMERVEFKADARNMQSRKAMEKIGAKKEGILRSHSINYDGNRRDTIYYSIISSEWPEVKVNLSRLAGIH